MRCDPWKEIDSCVNPSLGVGRKCGVEDKLAKSSLKMLAEMLLKLLSITLSIETCLYKF